MDYSTIAELIIKNGEPGAFWIENARKYGRLCDPPDYKDKKVIGTNPCISGCTLIAVADGRVAISIKQLVEEGKDVPVYSLNKITGDIEIKWGRKPRITGTNKKLYRVLFDDGNHIDVTENHKFLIMDKTEKETKELVKGDSIPRFKKEIFSEDYVRTRNIDTTELHMRVMFFKDFQERLSRDPTLEEFQEKYSGEYSEYWDRCWIISLLLRPFD